MSRPGRTVAEVPPDQRGVTAGMLTLSRNLGLVTGTSVMGAVFAFASATTDVTEAERSEACPTARVTERCRRHCGANSPRRQELQS